MSEFFGMPMMPGLSYYHKLSKALNITGVALSQGNNAKVYVQIKMKKYIMATVSKVIPQAPLDLKFSKGDQVTFTTEGDATVSVLGYFHDIDSEDEEGEDYTIEGLLKDRAKKNKNIEEDDDYRRLIEEHESLLKKIEETEDVKDEDSDEEEEEQPKAKVAKLSLETNAKKGAKRAEKLKEAKQPSSHKTKPEAKKKQPKAKDQTSKKQKPTGGKRYITDAVKISDIILGKGDKAKPGKRVWVNYIGQLQLNNKEVGKFFTGKGVEFTLGGGKELEGLEIGIAGMKVGGKRRITCPPYMAYKRHEWPLLIPPFSTVVFNVELTAVL